MRTFLLFIALASLLVLISRDASAQTRTVGAIKGTVVDDSGGIIPGATVRLRDQLSGAEREAVTDEQGVFSFLDLQAGTYEVRIALSGFRSAINVNGAFNIYDRDIEGTRQFPGDDITPQSVFMNNWMISF